MDDFNRQKVDEAANHLSLVADLLEESGLDDLWLAARKLMDDLETALDRK